MNIANSPIIEDHYIAYLAGLPHGQPTLGFMDKYNAYDAQKHPISNQISSSIFGSVKGITLAALGVLAYPLANEGMKSNILGSTWDICSTWANNFQTRAESRYILELKNIPTLFRQALENSYNVLNTAYLCVTDETVFEQCRANNYVASVMDTVTNNRLLIAALTIGLVAWCSTSKMSFYAMQENQTEKSLKNALSDRFGKIATRLKSLETNRDAQECARRILQHRLQINREIENLQLPSMTWRDIEQITQPVFDVAQMMQTRKI